MLAENVFGEEKRVWRKTAVLSSSGSKNRIIEKPGTENLRCRVDQTRIEERQNKKRKTRNQHQMWISIEASAQPKRSNGPRRLHKTISGREQVDQGLMAKPLDRTTKDLPPRSRKPNRRQKPIALSQQKQVEIEVKSLEPQHDDLIDEQQTSFRSYKNFKVYVYLLHEAHVHSKRFEK